MRTSVSAEAEDAVKQLMRALAQHRRHEAILRTSRTRPRGRLRSLPGDQQADAIRRQASLVRLVSMVEAFTTASLITRVEPHAPPPRTEILESIYSNAENDAVSSWSALQVSYKRWLGIRFNAFGSWKRVQATHDARNAIAHGLGDLTRRMVRSRSDPRHSLKLIDIAVIGIRIEIKESSLLAVADAGREFIEDLDAQLVAYDARVAGTAVAACGP